MKSRWIRVILVAAVFALVSRSAPAAVSVSISFFQSELDPYGSWVNVPSYGTCWAPARLSAGWQPYSVGQWIYTDYDWTWVSYDPWGGIPYHYGTWVFVVPYGWVWIPGTVWAPAWVTWSYSDSYIGWAPISPSIGISFSGYAGPPIVVSQNYYVFVPVNRFVGVNVSSVRVPSQQNAVIFRQTTQRTTNFAVSNGVLVNRGPSVQRVEQFAHMRIPRQSVSAAKVSPTPISAGGEKGARLAVVAPAPVREREIHATMKENKAIKSEQGGGAKPLEHKGKHEEHATTERYSPPPPPSGETHTMKKETDYRGSGKEHHGQQSVHQEAPPPPPPAREMHHESPPPHEAAAHHGSESHGSEASGKGHGASRGQQKPKKEKTPPPPPPQ